MKLWEEKPYAVVIADFEYAHDVRNMKHHGVFQIALGNPQGGWIVPPTTIDHGMTIQELANIQNVAMGDEPPAAKIARSHHSFRKFYGQGDWTLRTPGHTWVRIAQSSKTTPRYYLPIPIPD
jgi:hypothetical protein